jgi:hypothetical protein
MSNHPYRTEEMGSKIPIEEKENDSTRTNGEEGTPPFQSSVNTSLGRERGSILLFLSGLSPPLSPVVETRTTPETNKTATKERTKKKKQSEKRKTRYGSNEVDANKKRKQRKTKDHPPTKTGGEKEKKKKGRTAHSPQRR